jgi:C-terminal processing protease CtpA/Prc
MTKCVRLLSCAVLLLCAATAHAQPATNAAATWSGTTEQKVWGLMTVWAEARYTFPHFERRPDLDWDRTVQAYIPRVIAAPDMDAYYEVLSELVALLKDGHTSVLPPWGHIKPGYDMAPIEVRILDGRFYVDRIGDAPELAAQGIRPGDEILEIDGLPAGRHFAEKVLRYHAVNTPHGDEAFQTVYLLYGPAGERVALKTRRPDGASQDVAVTRDAMSGGAPFMTRMLRNIFDGPTIRTRMLPGGIQYVEIPNFNGMQASEDFTALVDGLDEQVVKGMIIDVRYNMGGSSSVVAAMVGCLIDQPVTTPVMKFRHFIGAYEAWGKEPVWETASNDIAPRAGKRYLGPLVVLTGGLTSSSSEDFAIELHSGGRARLVGERTCGSAGNGLSSPLPGGGTFTVGTFTALVPGGEEYVGVGVAPDVEARPTPADLVTGRDVVLDRALELLGN